MAQPLLPLPDLRLHFISSTRLPKFNKTESQQVLDELIRSRSEPRCQRRQCPVPRAGSGRSRPERSSAAPAGPARPSSAPRGSFPSPPSSPLPAFPSRTPAGGDSDLPVSAPLAHSPQQQSGSPSLEIQAFLTKIGGLGPSYPCAPTTALLPPPYFSELFSPPQILLSEGFFLFPVAKKPLNYFGACCFLGFFLFHQERAV